MTRSDYIIEVNETDFEYEVLNYSRQAPVIVDFWAEWCAPCRLLGPMLEKLAQEAQGAFRLAKVNVDHNPNLALRYGVRSIPAVKAFRDGKMIAEFVGVQPEGRIRELLRAIAPSQSDLLLEKGGSLLLENQFVEAEHAYRQALALTPDSTAARLGLAKSLLFQGKGEEAKELLTDFPHSREFSQVQTLSTLANVLCELKENVPSENNHPLEAAFHHALRLFKRGNIEAALDGLLDILREDKHYREGEVKKVILAILELLGDERQMTRQYRNELASILF